MKFQAMVIRKEGDAFLRAIEERSFDDLPQGDVLIRVHYSSLNYKDALSTIGNRGVTKQYPHTPGIDAAGIVVSSTDASFHEGDQVLCCGYDLGMDTDGGFAEYIRVPAAWVMPLPDNFDLFESMQIGTAGFTAAYCLHKLELNGLRPDQGDVLVTGATGGVGSVAVALLHHAGYLVVAATRKTDEENFLRSLGANEIVDSTLLKSNPDRPLLRGRWAAGIDTVGGDILAGIISACKPLGSVTTCGLTLSPILNTTVFPFILRGVNLLGINAADTPMPMRRDLWKQISLKWKPQLPENYAQVCTLDGLFEKIDLILAGKMRGRAVLKLI